MELKHRFLGSLTSLKGLLGDGPDEPTTLASDIGLWVLCFSYILSQFFRSYVAVIAPQLIDDFRFSPQMFGWFAGAFFLFFALAQIPIGMAFDRFGVRVPTACLMALGTLSAGVLSWTTDPWIAVASQIGIGLGCAPVFMGLLNHVLAGGAGVQQTRAVTIASAIGMAGALLAAWPLSRATAQFGWRPVMVIATAAMFCATLGVAGFVKRRNQGVHATQHAAQGHSPTPGGRAFWTLAPACLAMSVGGTFRTSWAGPYFADVFGFDVMTRGYALTVTSLVGAGVSFSIPLLVRVWTPKSLSLCGLVLGALAALALAVAPGLSSVLGVGLISVLFSVGAIHPLVMSQARVIVPDHRLGLALGLLNSLVFLGVALASGCFGWIVGEAKTVHATTAHVYGLLFAVTALPLTLGAIVFVFSPGAKSHSL
jgi:MFS family permease